VFTLCSPNLQSQQAENNIRTMKPDSTVVQPGQSLTITCRPSGFSLTDSGYATAWLRQPAGKALEWIGGSGEGSGWNTYYKDSLKNKFSITFVSSTNTATLNGRNMQPEDSAVYYCAREPQ
uniref:Ig-like domain-containing protein n=1 Tax=Fundulus heteroclitus TaxID=8078 RepID=A0A3Q2Q6E3_FUNHE